MLREMQCEDGALGKQFIRDAFMTAKRTRETGIRRVMGASQNEIPSPFLLQFSR